MERAEILEMSLPANGMTIEERERLARVEEQLKHVISSLDTAAEELSQVRQSLREISALANQGKGGLKVLLVAGSVVGAILGSIATFSAEHLTFH